MLCTGSGSYHPSPILDACRGPSHLNERENPNKMCFSYPAPGASIFGKLQKGSVVVLLQGAGHPPVEDVTTSEVIIAVDGFLALTNAGRLLACTDAVLIDVLGETLADGEDAFLSSHLLLP